MGAAKTFDTAQNDSTPAAGKNADLETRVEQLAAVVNDHAVTLDILDPSGAGVVLTADAAGRARIAAGFFDAATADSAIAAGVLGQELLEAELDGTSVANVADAAVSPASTQLGHDGTISIQHADHATETLIYKTTRKIQIVDVVILKSGAGAANTSQVQDGAANNITNAIAADTDKTVTRAGTIDPAFSTLAAGATFQIVFTRAAGSSLQQVLIKTIPRA